MSVYLLRFILCLFILFFLMILRPPRSTRTDTLFPSRRSSDLHRSNMMRFLTRKYLIAGALSVSTVGSLVMGLTITSTPAQAQITVFDPGNYSQNLLTAARTLQQINNQIQSLQNEANMLVRSEEHTSELQSLMRISYAVFCLKK